jgi:hypothetical protein
MVDLESLPVRARVRLWFLGARSPISGRRCVAPRREVRWARRRRSSRSCAPGWALERIGFAPRRGSDAAPSRLRGARARRRGGRRPCRCFCSRRRLGPTPRSADRPGSADRRDRRSADTRRVRVGVVPHRRRREGRHAEGVAIHASHFRRSWRVGAAILPIKTCFGSSTWGASEMSPFSSTTEGSPIIGVGGGAPIIVRSMC